MCSVDSLNMQYVIGICEKVLHKLYNFKHFVKIDQKSAEAMQKPNQQLPALPNVCKLRYNLGLIDYCKVSCLRFYNICTRISIIN